MTKQELEDIYILSLDAVLNVADQERLTNALKDHPDWARSLAMHKKTRELLLNRYPASFGPYFPSKLINKIQNTGIVIDRQIFGLFRKFQLVAAGVVIALVILNMVYSGQHDLKSLFGIEQGITTQQDTEVPFDFSETLNNL